MYSRLILFIIGLSLSVILSNCSVSMSGMSIDYKKTKSFSIEQFENQTSNAPGNVGQQFSEKLRSRIISETRLENNIYDGDLQFSGGITKYDVSSVAPQAGTTTSNQRLTIAVSVNFENMKEEDKSWKKTFTRFADFSSDQNLIDVQNQLIEQIYTELIDDIFNKSFSDW